MEPILNSPIKEAIRQQYEEQAVNEETQIKSQLKNDIIFIQKDTADRIRHIRHKNPPLVSDCISLLFLFGSIFEILGSLGRIRWGFVIGALSGIIIHGIWSIRVDAFNNQVDFNKAKIQHKSIRKIHQLRDNAASQIETVYAEADRKTLQDIDQYDTEVQRNCQSILEKKDIFQPMVDHSVNMFQRMVSHADSGSNKKFVETEFTFKVELYGICYKYQSTYMNPKDDFNFDIERYRNLTTSEECEGLAKAITELTIRKMKELYSSDSLTIKVEHIDAEVTLHYKAANKNYRPPIGIYDSEGNL